MICFEMRSRSSDVAGDEWTITYMTDFVFQHG
jgi:hypothetical protein